MGICWYAVHVRSNQERVAREYLEALGIELFLPTYREVSRRSDRRVILDRPLFSGYLFVRMDVEGPVRREVIQAPGVVNVIGFGGNVVPVPDETIESIRILIGDGSGPPQMLAIGSNDEVLTADSGETTGVKWSAAAGGGVALAAQDFAWIRLFGH